VGDTEKKNLEKEKNKVQELKHFMQQSLKLHIFNQGL